MFLFYIYSSADTYWENCDYVTVTAGQSGSTDTGGSVEITEHNVGWPAISEIHLFLAPTWADKKLVFVSKEMFKIEMRVFGTQQEH